MPANTLPKNIEARGDTLYFRAKIHGKVHRESTGYKVGSKRALELAVRRAREIETEIRAQGHGYVKKTIPTFEEWAEIFLAAFYPGKADVKYNTEANLMRRPIARWGTTRIDRLTRTDMEMFFREREAAGAKNGGLERERVLLKSCFRAAIDDGLIKVNPLAGIRGYRTKARTRVMTTAEEVTLRAALDEQWNRWLTFMLTTGLRLGEAMGAKPSDLREDGAWHWVRPELNKTRVGRMIPLRPETQKVLKEQQAYRGSRDDQTYFGLTTSAAQMTLRRHCIALGITPRVSPHDLRRTFATRCAEGGMLLVHLQKILGHTSPTITARFYLHLEQATTLDAILKVEL